MSRTERNDENGKLYERLVNLVLFGFNEECLRKPDLRRHNSRAFPTALAYWCYQQNVDYINILLQAGANPRARCGRGAYRKLHADQMRQALGERAQCLEFDTDDSGSVGFDLSLGRDGDTVLTVASFTGNTEIIGLLLQAIERRRWRLLPTSPKLRSQLNRALVAAAHSRNIEACEVLMRAGASVHFDKGACMRAAAERGGIAMVDFLVGAGAQLTNGRNDWDVLRLAATWHFPRGDRAALTRHLLDLHEWPQKALDEVLLQGPDVDVVRALIEDGGARVSAAVLHHFACKRYVDEEVFDLVYEHGKEADDTVPLEQWAASLERVVFQAGTMDERDYVPNVERILRVAPELDVNAVVRVDERRRTLLHTAVAGRRHKIALILLQHGARSNVVDADGKTPLDLLEYGPLGRTSTDIEMERLLKKQAEVGKNVKGARRRRHSSRKEA